MKKYYYLIVLGLVILAGCKKEGNLLLNRTEEVLPGAWSLEMVKLPAYGLGITYENTTF